MTGIIYYGAGNLYSLQCALDRIEAPYTLITTPAQLYTVDRIIIPGVGHAAAAMQQLKDTRLIPNIKAYTNPVLGICLGMQLLTTHSEEGDVPLLDLVPLHTKRFVVDGLKVPQMGWNTVNPVNENPLFKGIDDNSYFYFVHSYAVEAHPQYSAALTTYGAPYSSAILRDNFMGVQFHPEKSGIAGEILLRNFINL